MEKNEIDAIMEERIEKFNNFMMSQDINKIPFDLYGGKMGICIYFFHQARLSKNKGYEKFAEKILNEIYSELHEDLPIDIETGIAGIGFGINYLVLNNFINGDVNKVLRDIDARIFKVIAFNILPKRIDLNHMPLNLIIGSIYYFYLRLKNDRLEHYTQIVFKNMIIKLINYIEDNEYTELFEEPIEFNITNYYLPLYLILLTKIYELDIYNYKIIKILDELSPKILSHLPLLHSNRLYFFIALDVILSRIHIPEWENHASIIYGNINYDSINNIEFKNKKICLANGLSGYSLLTKYMKIRDPLQNTLISKKIALSDFWNDFYINEAKIPYRIGLFSGLCGIILNYQECIKIRE
jgi:hypothetical protein